MSTKWADYAITATKMDTDKKHIVEVKIYEDTGDKLANPQTVKRTTVVKMLNDSKTFVTARMNKDTGQWEKGSPVHIIKVNGVEYLRTDSNQIASDNLGNLPEI